MFSGQIPFEPSSANGDRFDTQLPQGPAQAEGRCDRFCAIISDKFQLRRLQVSDAEALFSAVDQNREHLACWLPWPSATKTVRDTRDFICSKQELARANKGFAAALCCNQKIIGVIELHSIDWANWSSSVGYWIARAYQGQGLMTTACRTVLDYGFSALGLNRIEIRCAAENHRSKAIPQRLGFTHEGTLRQVQWLDNHYVDHLVYAILRQDWPNR